MNKNILSKSLARYLVVQAIFSQSFGLEKHEIEKSFVKTYEKYAKICKHV